MSESKLVVSVGSGTELRDLLAPLTVERLIQAFHDNRPFFRKGNPERYRELFSIEEFDRTLGSFSHGARPTTFEVSAVLTPSEGEGRVLRMIPIEPWDFASTLRAGASVRALRLEQVHDKSARLAAALKSQLGYLGNASMAAVRSPDGQGYTRHFDNVFVLSLQIAGRKTWRYSPLPALSWPPASATCGPDGEPRWRSTPSSDRPLPATQKFAPEDFLEVTLEPGDLLVVPPGVWHEARAHGESLALSFSFEAFSFTSLLATLFESQFQLDPSWFAAPPLMAGASAPDEVARASRAYVAERLREAVEHLGAVEPEGLAMLHSIAGNVVESATFLSRQAGGKDPPAPESSSKPLGDDDELAFGTHDYLYSYLPSDGSGVRLFVGLDRLDLPVDALPLVEFLTGHRRFFVRDAVLSIAGRMPAPLVRRYLRALVAQAILTRMAGSD